MSDVPRSPEPIEPEQEPSEPSTAAPEASVARRDDDADAPHPKVARMDVDPDAPDAEHLETERTNDSVSVRRAPRYPAFIVAGIVLGAVLALVLTFAYPENGEFDRGQVFGFIVLWCAAFGAALGGVVALIVDRRLAKRRGSAVAEHESTHFVDGDSPS
ncbi:hypothetical protein BCL57_001341 [Agromyces flavus]|uniref:Uncharacterized protein n=1 Tax=Agromyces flavus TaxID=589382 RepID=A0A1H1ZP54_9MICO|nr:hypothetical protein [Agromyces flavus]MCP2367187.1 hypothetical protein [Agromyces flavus]GGI46227.1 hypothetical protein GCM10010932_13540 [Agromyces flavus]SDT35399.1 hypothetical protein SAMN04489721_3266 [Agromyces flavus]